MLAGLHVVLIDQRSDKWPGVLTDAEGAGAAAAEHLLSLGHREVAFVGPAADLDAFRLRERGFVKRMREAGVAIPSERLRRAPATAAGGRDAMRALLALRPRPTAVFCANDLLALGAVKACSAAGVPVPAEMSVVGCDDIEMARLVSPELTTVAVPARELGARAARLLVRALERRPPSGRREQLLPVKLVARGTSGPVPGGRA